MNDSNDTLDDEAFLDQLLELAMACRAEGRELVLDDLVRGREHLRARGQRVLEVALALAPVAAPQSPTRWLPQLTDYTILDEAGRGSMGIVYRARQERLGRIVALKVLTPALTHSASARDRFAVEARAVGRVNHPNVVAVHDVLVGPDLCAYAMEWVEGSSLANVVAATEQGLDPTTVARLGATLARALVAVHGEGLVHRDVKPSNVLLRHDGSPVLTDFSLVRDQQQALQTATGEFLGTAAYAAPEQLRGEHDRVGPWTDIYALAATLRVALTGATPFASSSTREQLRRVDNGPPAWPRKHIAKLPRDLVTIVSKAMDPEPTRRYATATEFAEDLERMLRCEPIFARRAGLALKVQRFIERSPQLALALAGLVLALGFALAVSIYFTANLRAAEQRARVETEIQGQYAEFLRWVFRMGDASGYGRKDMTVLEALEQIAQQVDGKTNPRYRPESQYLIRMMVGETLANVGRDLEALKHLAAAQGLALELFGPNSQQAAATVTMKGRVQRSLGQLADAEQSLREAVRLRRMTETEQPRELAQSLSSLGIVLRQQGKLADAEQQYLAALAIYRTACGPANENVAIVLGNLASLWQQQNRLADAERVQTEALALLTKSQNGLPDIDLAHAQFKLGDIQFQTGQTEVGEAAMRAGLAMTESLTGTQHKRVAELSARLAKNLAPTQAAAAEGLFRASANTYLALGNPAQACAQSVALADLLLDNNRPGDAEVVLTRAIEFTKERTERLGLLRRLGLARTRLAQFETAEAALVEAWSMGERHQADRQAVAAALAGLYGAWHAASPDPSRAAKAAEWRRQAIDR